MQRVLILYFSGAGSTKAIAAEMHKALQGRCAATLCSLEGASPAMLDVCDALILGTPVYHGAPAKLVMDFIYSIEIRTTPLPVFLFNARSTWSCNTNRIMAMALAKKNIVTVLDRDYRAPASDGSLLLPGIGYFFEFSKHLKAKVRLDSRRFLHMAEYGGYRGYIPRFRASSLVNAPNKLAGQMVTFPIHLQRDKCTGCGLCHASCPHGAIRLGADGYPTVETARCENCYRCIHHCPAKAFSLSKRRPPKKQLTHTLK